MSGVGRRRWRRAARALAAGVGLVLGVGAMAQAVPRLMVMDLPYERVWANARQAMAEACPVTRAEGGVIECDRIERDPRAGESGLERVAERVLVRVEALADRVTRITVEVSAEGLRGGRWEPVDGSETARAVLGRIRAAQG